MSIKLRLVRTRDCRTSTTHSTTERLALRIAAASVSGAKRLISARSSPGKRSASKEVQDDIWLVSFIDYDLGYFDLETRVLEPLENPFGPKVLPSTMCYLCSRAGP